MHSPVDHHDSPMARRFSQVFIIALAGLITSGTGLLSYVNQGDGPGWLRMTVIATAVMVGTSFAGWVAASFAAHWRDQQDLRG